MWSRRHGPHVDDGVTNQAAAAAAAVMYSPGVQLSGAQSVSTSVTFDRRLNGVSADHVANQTAAAAAGTADKV